jgi:hypothetical protein
MRTYSRTAPAVAALSLLLVVGCGTAEPPAAPIAEPADAADTVLVARSGGGVIELPLRDEAALRQLQGLGVEPAPGLELTAPTAGSTLEPGPLTVQYEIANYEVGQEIGQHVHLILDNQAYKADYSPTGSVTFAAEELAPGVHTLTAFLSRPMHLSVKNAEAADRVVFHVGEASAATGHDLDAPALIYSRPKGSYSRSDGAASNLMLDFYLFNVELTEGGYHVRATVDGGPATIIQTWGPRVILTDPAPGEHTVRLELLDAAGLPVPGPTNDTTRTITVTE